MRKLIVILFMFTFLFMLIPLNSVFGMHRYDLQDLGIISGNYSVARSINESEQVVGSSGDYAVLWENGIGTILGTGYASDINDFGQIAGLTRSGDKGAVIWENGTATYLNAPGGERSWGNGINNLGQVAIYSPSSEDKSAPYHAYYWDPILGIVDLDTTGTSYAHDINDSSVVVGRIGPGYGTAARWENGSLILYEGLTHFNAINDSGQMVGWARGLGAVLVDKDEITIIGGLDGEIMSSAMAINNLGQIVGKSGEGDIWNERAFIWENRTIHDLNDLIDPSSGFTLLSAYGINDSGQIVGAGEIDGERHAFLLTPIIEPSIDAIIEFFDESVVDGTVYGSGKKLHIANLKLWLFRKTLETAKYFIEKDEIEYACKALNRAFLHCDSDPRPKDFIEGEGVAELADMILELMDELGCE